MYPGVLAVRRGEMAFIQDMKYREKMVSVNPAAAIPNVAAPIPPRTALQAVPSSSAPSLAVPDSGISSSAVSRRSKKKSGPGV